MSEAINIVTNSETVEIVNESPEVVLVEIVNPAGPTGPAGTTLWSGLTGTAPKVPFTTTNGGPTALGELAWLAETETLCLRLKNGENLDVGEEMIYHVENATGSTITKGTAVSYAGTVGGSGKIRVKPWNGITDAPEAFMGIVMGDIANNATGYVTAFGQVRGVNTSAFSDGVILYANPSGTGLTATKPSATHVIACLCVRAANNGTLLVRPVVSEIATWDSVTGKPTVIVEGDARLTNSREWSAETISQTEAEAGASTTRRAFTAQRVFQAIAAWWNASAFKTKLDGIASGATANQTDAFLLSRTNHTGTQLAATISDFNTAVASTPPASHTHPISQVVGLETALNARLQTQTRMLTSNVTRTSSVISADATLTIPLLANTNYEIEVWFNAVMTGGGGLNLEARYSGTVDASIVQGQIAGSGFGTGAVSVVFQNAQWDITGSPRIPMVVTNNTTTPRANNYRIFFRTATAGNFTIFWANSTGTGDATLLQGSSLIATQL